MTTATIHTTQGAVVVEFFDADADFLVGSRAFHETVIRGIRFEATLHPGGMHLTAYDGADDLGGIPLDSRSSIGVKRREDGPGYAPCLCKYNEVHVALDGFGPDDTAVLEREFGLSATLDRRFVPFAETGAFLGLVRYVVTHPRMAAQAAHARQDDGTRHLKALYDLAREEASAGRTLSVM